MRSRSQWVWPEIVEEFEANTRRNEGADFCFFVVGQKKGTGRCFRVLLR